MCEGPFNLWSLAQWGKSAVALLGTGTEYQYKLLSKVKCNGYVLCLDPDDAGRKGTNKIGKYLTRRHKLVYVVDMPVGYDVNDLTKEQYDVLEVLDFNIWQQKYNYR